MPWKGRNFEDAIVSERLVKDDAHLDPSRARDRRP
jgi:DNA-directed RNA polymerase beta subunit